MDKKEWSVIFRLQRLLEEKRGSKNNPKELMASSIISKSRVIADGFNSNKSHPLQAKHGRNAKAIFLHAEIDAIRRALSTQPRLDFSRTTMYVVRISSGGLRLAKPCSGCLGAISAFGLTRVIYSIDQKTFGVLHPL